MPNQPEREQVDLNESSVYGEENSTPTFRKSEDVATDAALDRLEVITGGADEPAIFEGALGQKFDELDASTGEELDALEVNLMQEDERPNARDGSGLIVDDSAEERLPVSLRLIRCRPTSEPSALRRAAMTPAPFCTGTIQIRLLLALTR